MKYIMYRVAGFGGRCVGPYTSDDINFHYNDIKTFDGVSDVKIVDALGVDGWRGRTFIEKYLTEDDDHRGYGIVKKWVSIKNNNVVINLCSGAYDEWLVEWYSVTGWGKTLNEAKSNCDKECIRQAMALADGLDLVEVGKR